VLAFGPGIRRERLGRRSSFCDIGASVARRLGLEGQRGVAF
jgi:phosphopentomutase